TDYTQEVKDFFTKRNLWWGYYEWQGERYIGTKDNWSFGYQMDDPRVKNMNPDDLVATHNGKKEQAAVTPAQHPSSLVGKSWSRASGEPKLNEYDLPEPTYVPWLDQTVENPEGYGIYFQERWDEAINSDPEFIYINDWNEWNAGKYHDGALRTFMGRENSSYYFVDQYNSEFNRCVQPMKGGYTDNYYMQMVQNIRRYKGVRQHNLNIEVSDRSVDNDFSDWKLDTIEFRDAIGDTRHRKHNGYGGLEYIDTLGRNDIICSKVAYDNDSLYFYVETVRELSSHNVPNWMLLFIDIDRNKGTGWEGYDYIINHSVNSTNQTTLKQWTGLGWENEVPIPYAYNGSEMEIGVSRSSLNLQEDKPEFYFKWADNPKHFNDISGFFAGGESAPDRRFNYNYSATDVLVAEQLPFRELDIPGSIEMEDFDNGGAGIAYADAVYGNSGGAYRANESVDIKEKANNEYYITDIYNNEWLEYTVNVNATGLYSVTIYYIADADNQELSLLMNDSEISSFSFPKTETDDAWSTVQNVVRIKSGTQILKLAADSVLGGVHIDKIVFDKKEVVYPDNGTGLMQTLYNGAIGGRKWFADSICSRIDPTIDHKWIAGESPGCETRSTFWNARWEGWVEAHYSEEYTISLSVNDYGRLWFDGELIIDAWSVGDANKTHDAKINLTANEKKSITIEFANKTEDGSIKMEWESPSQFKEVIPQTQLFPANTTSSVSHMFNKVPVIYPNPATSHVYIRTFSLSKIAVYNYSGQEVYFDEIHSDIHDIDVSLWEPGIYIVKIKGANKVFNQKMLIK
ncbi:MAG TPA: PA14 domain-containing protein, partial [Bacteroidales bacterium]|nr:PA14 domain-containing protein [Bacteroidales bacterium]